MVYDAPLVTIVTKTVNQHFKLNIISSFIRYHVINITCIII